MAEENWSELWVESHRKLVEERGDEIKAEIAKGERFFREMAMGFPNGWSEDE